MLDRRQLAHRIERQEGRRLVLVLREIDRHDAIRRAGLLDHPAHHLRARLRDCDRRRSLRSSRFPLRAKDGACLHPGRRPRPRSGQSLCAQRAAANDFTFLAGVSVGTSTLGADCLSSAAADWPTSRCRRPSSPLRDSACPRPRRAAAPPRGARRRRADSATSSAPRFSSTPLGALGAGDRHDVGALRQQPGERDLPRRAALRAAPSPRCAATSCEVAREIVAGEARMAAAAVALGNVGRLLHRAGQQAAAERRIGDEGDAERARGLAASPRPARDRAASIRSAPRRSDAPCARGGWSRAWPRSGRAPAPCPAFTSSPIAPTVSSIGTEGSTRCW